MDVYRQAASIVKDVLDRKGTAKALCLSKQVQKKKQTFAVVCETIRNLDRIERVLADAQFFEYYPKLRPEKFLVCALCYDAVFGKGVNTRQHAAALAVVESTPFLKEAEAKLPARNSKDNNNKAELLLGGADDGDFDEGTTSDNKKQQKVTVASLNLPRYARINALALDPSTTSEQLLQRLQQQTFRRSGVALRRERNEQGDDDEDVPSGWQTLQDQQRTARPEWDAHLPGLIVFPAGTDLHSHPLVKKGVLVLQDKASCIPAAVMFDKVEVATTAATKEKNDADDGDDADAGDGAKQHQQQQQKQQRQDIVVDACSAPGNKTLQLIEYFVESNNKSDSDAAVAAAAADDDNTKNAGSGGVIAVERDPKRFELLQKRMISSSVSGRHSSWPVIQCREGSFDSDGIFSEAEAERVTALLLDPSCSSSGVISRIDVATNKRDNDEAAEGEDAEVEDATAAQKRRNEMQKVRSLAEVQLQLMKHAMSAFPNARTIVYSTCSVHQEENENVVMRALEFAQQQFAEASMSKKEQKKQNKKKKNASSSSSTPMSCWTVSKIMPTNWTTRGRVVDPIPGCSISGDEAAAAAQCCVRCDPFVDKTSGFFVARFDRETVVL